MKGEGVKLVVKALKTRSASIFPFLSSGYKPCKLDKTYRKLCMQTREENLNGREGQGKQKVNLQTNIISLGPKKDA